MEPAHWLSEVSDGDSLPQLTHEVVVGGLPAVRECDEGAKFQSPDN